MQPANRPIFERRFVAAQEDIDQLGHVNNTVYLRWVQDIATAHWEAVARPEDQAAFLWVVLRHEIDYLAPTALGETIVGTTWVGEPKGARFDRYVQLAGSEDGRKRASAKTSWAMVDARTMRPLRIPPAVAAPFMTV